MKYTYHNGKFDLDTDRDKVFVFGSNLLGQHGGGAAKFAAKHFDAQWGIGQGIMLYGESYALPTKITPSEPMDRTLVVCAIKLFKAYATAVFQSTDEDITFFVTAVGTGLAGFTHEEIAPLFRGSSTNCIFPPEWKEFLEEPDNAS